MKHTQDFVWETYHKKDILLGDVSRQFIEDYEFWLKTEKKCCHNTATKYLKNFKKIIRIALAKGWMKNDPFSEIKFSLDKVEPDFLEDSEIQKLISKEIDIPRLGQVRDVFVFCCFTLTTHVARHTFATFALANGVSIESVAKMLGHTNVQMTRHYARVLDRTVIREMSQVRMDFQLSL